MTDIKNTTAAMQNDPVEAMLLLADGMVTGSANSFIESQERQGQRELVNSDRLPSDIKDRPAFEALGFTFGEPDADDPLFMPAAIPAGWKREASDHDMWSYIVDDLGRKRVAVFYKAAFYDRKAFARLESLDWYVTQAVEYDGPAVIFDEKWATREAVAASMAASRDDALEGAAEFKRYATDEAPGRNPEGCARIAGEKEETAAKYAAAIKALEASNA